MDLLPTMRSPSVCAPEIDRRQSIPWRNHLQYSSPIPIRGAIRHFLWIEIRAIDEMLSMPIRLRHMLAHRNLRTQHQFLPSCRDHCNSRTRLAFYDGMASDPQP